MEVQQVLHMNGGDGEISYASNSEVHKLGISKAIPLITRSISDLYSTMLSECLRIADLGCSSGSNTLLITTEIIDAIHQKCHQLNHKAPEFLVFLNDLPSNDFNNIFKTLPTFYEQLKKEKGEQFGPCCITGVPGSFYERLFPTSSIDFFYSTYSLHWLSQVPPTIETNKGNVYLSRTSPPSVVKAYLEQFQKDFTLFLSLRSKEITPGGRMVLTFLGRRSEDPFRKEEKVIVEDILSDSLNDLVLEDLIEEAKVDAFNLPIYMSSSKELESIVNAKGSFYLDHFEIFDINWYRSDGDDDNKTFMLDGVTGQKIAKTMRAVFEPMLLSHFGDSITDTILCRCMEYLKKSEGTVLTLSISLRAK